MTKKAFDKIAGGLTEALAVVREEAQSARLHVPIRTAPLAIILRWLACPHMSAAELHRVVRGLRTLRGTGRITADPVLMAEANSWR